MKKLKSSGYKGGDVKIIEKVEVNKIEEKIQNDLSSFYDLIKNRYINNDLTQQDITLYLLCLHEFIETGKSNTGITTNFGLQYMISHIEKSLEARVLKRKHLHQQVDYFTDLLKVTQNPLQQKRTKPSKGKISSENYSKGNVKSKQKLPKQNSLDLDINNSLQKLQQLYYENKVQKHDLECYIDCLRYLKEDKLYSSLPKNKLLVNFFNLNKNSYKLKSNNFPYLDQQIEGVIKILTTITPKTIEPKRTKPTKGKVNTLSKGYKK